MQFVLKIVLYFVFQVVWNVIAVCDVPYPCQRYCLHELICEGGQISFDTPYYKAILLCFELTVQLLMESVGDASVMVWAEVSLLSTCNLPRRDEVQKGRDRGESFCFEPVFILVYVCDVGCDF